jgi:phosphohistidine phosphatase SixA
MIVGHEPDFSMLIATLLGMKTNASLAISKASLTAMDLTCVTQGSGLLRFFLPVKLLK